MMIALRGEVCPPFFLSLFSSLCLSLGRVQLWCIRDLSCFCSICVREHELGFPLIKNTSHHKQGSGSLFFSCLGLNAIYFFLWNPHSSFLSAAVTLDRYRWEFSVMFPLPHTSAFMDWTAAFFWVPKLNVSVFLTLEQSGAWIKP